MITGWDALLRGAIVAVLVIVIVIVVTRRGTCPAGI